jgi:hypothetical protein
MQLPYFKHYSFVEQIKPRLDDMAIIQHLLKKIRTHDLFISIATMDEELFVLNEL